MFDEHGARIGRIRPWEISAMMTCYGRDCSGGGLRGIEVDGVPSEEARKKRWSGGLPSRETQHEDERDSKSLWKRRHQRLQKKDEDRHKGIAGETPSSPPKELLQMK